MNDNEKLIWACVYANEFACVREEAGCWSAAHAVAKAAAEEAVRVYREAAK